VAEVGPTKSSASPETAQPARSKRPIEAIDRVLIISVDGLRPDLALRADMPHLRKLCKNGSYTFWAETTPEAYTLPCHVSMLTGVSAEKHGVTWNEYIEESYPNVATLFEIARRAGLKTAMAAGKMKFIVFTKPGALDDYYYPLEEPVSDHEVAVHAQKLMRKLRPHVMFVHLPGVDTAGHEFGWGSCEQITSIEQADAAIGEVLDCLAALKLTDLTLTILTADHGGAAKDHAMNDPRSRFIPWIASGPGLRKDFDLTLFDSLHVRTEDTFATACAFLGIQTADECRGHPVLETLGRLDSNVASQSRRNTN
jgi:predicted AlkP superfamily pyrophosphatase or phosphodiesterase